MNSQTISVIITTYARNEFLAECLQSLAEQTLSLHEVVVVDDGGDGSARGVVEKYGGRFRYIWQPNGGQQSARNLGARQSSGAWISFLDDDDLWLSNRHALIGELIATGKVDLVSGDFTKFGAGWVAPTGVFDEIGAQSPGFWEGIQHEPGSSFSIVGKFPTIRLFPVYPFWPSTLVVRRDLFERLGGWNTKVRGIRTEDNEFGFRAIKNGQLGIIWPSTVRYRCHDGNRTKNPLLNAIGRTQIWEIMLANLELTEDERQAIVSAIEVMRHQIIWSAFKEGEYATVVQTAKKMGKSKLSVSERIKARLSRTRA